MAGQGIDGPTRPKEAENRDGAGWNLGMARIHHGVGKTPAGDAIGHFLKRFQIVHAEDDFASPSGAPAFKQPCATSVGDNVNGSVGALR